MVVRAGVCVWGVHGSTGSHEGLRETNVYGDSIVLATAREGVAEVWPEKQAAARPASVRSCSAG